MKIEVMRCSTYGEVMPAVGWWVQPKLNGICAIYDVGERRFQSRQGKLWNPNVVEHLTPSNIHPDVTALIGEFYYHGWPLERIRGAVAINRLEPNEDTKALEFTIYNCITKNPFEPYSSRFNKILHGAIATNSLKDVEDVDSYYDIHRSENFEGSVYINPAASFTPGASKHLIKRKPWPDMEGRIVSITEGKGKFKGMLGAFEVVLPSGQHLSVGGGNMDDALRREFWLGQLRLIGRRLTFRYAYKSASGLPQQPQFTCIRDYE